MTSSLITLLAALILLPLIQASIHCSIHGDTHVVMSDGATKYQHHSAGLFRAFATSMNTKRMEVQCEFTDRSTIQSQAVDPQMSGCRMKVVDTILGCGIDIRHGGIEQPGIGSIMGRDMPLSAMSQIALNPALGVNVIPLSNNGLSVEINWNGTLIQVIMAERLLQVHSTMIPKCQGLCGSCSGSQQLPGMDPNTVSNFIAQHAIQASAAIQPDQGCSSPSVSGRLLSGSSPQLFLQTSAQSQMYPVPAYRAPSISDALYQAQFESQQVLMQSFQQCSDNDQHRLQVDPWFNSFVEDCMYDKSLGPGFESSAKASMDAYVTWTESLLRWARIGRALSQAPLLQVCVACIPVTWTDPVQTNAILTPTVTQRRGSIMFPLRYSNSASQFLVPGRFVQSYVGQDFLSGSWNSPITLSPLSQLNMLPLPQQLISSPIVVGPNSNDLAGQQLTFNPMPSISSGTCSIFDQQSMTSYDQLAGQFLNNGQSSQLLQLIQQGRYPYLACALTCLSGPLSSAFSSMSSLALSFQLAEVASLCPSQQYLNGFGSGLFGNGFSSQLASLNGPNGFNSLSLFNGMNGYPMLNGMNGYPMLNGLSGLSPLSNMINGMPILPNGLPLNAINGNAINGLPPNAVNNGFPTNGINGINNLLALPNGINGIPSMTNGINGVPLSLNNVNGVPMTGIGNAVPANQLLNPTSNFNSPVMNNLNGIGGLNSMDGLNPLLNNLNGLNSFNTMNNLNGINPLNGAAINSLNPINNLNAANNLNSLGNFNGAAQPANQVLGQNQAVTNFMF